MADDTVQPAHDPLPPNPGEPARPVVDWIQGSSLPLTILACLAAVFMLQWLSVVLIPVVIGVLLAYAVNPLVSLLARVRIPRALGAALVLLGLLGILALAVYSLTGQALQIVRQVPKAAQRVQERVRNRDLRNPGALGEVQKAATELQKTAEVAARQPEQKGAPRDGLPRVQQVEIVEPAFDANSYLYWGGMNLIGAAGQFTVILFLVYFFLVTGHLYKRKFVKLAGPALWQKKLTVQILEEINAQVSSFIRVQVVTSAVVAIATMIALWFFGVQQYIIWGLLAGVFNSIPYLGPILVSGALGVVVFIQFDDVPKTLTVVGVVMLITTLEGYLLTPTLMSRAARMNPVAIFVGLLFWTWVWGIAGTVLAVPMLMMIKAVCDQIEDLQPVGELLGE